MNINDEILKNPILRNVQVKFENQTTKGLAKYGETVNPKSYDTIAWLKHLQEELIDGVVYIEVLIQKVKELECENKKLQERNVANLRHIDELSNNLFKKYQQVEKLQKALAFYASEVTYSKELHEYGAIKNCIFCDRGKIAREALEETK